MKTSMSITIIFFVTFFAISVASMAKTTNPEEDCIRRNLGWSQAPRSSAESKPSGFESFVDQLCRDSSRAIMFYVRIFKQFPSHYVKSLCNVFENDEKKVKEYFVKRWMGLSHLASGFTCISH